MYERPVVKQLTLGRHGQIELDGLICMLPPGGEASTFGNTCHRCKDSFETVSGPRSRIAVVTTSLSSDEKKNYDGKLKRALEAEKVNVVHEYRKGDKESARMVIEKVLGGQGSDLLKMPEMSKCRCV